MKDEEIRRKFRELSKAPIQVFEADVIAIDEDAQTIDVKPPGQAELLDVRMKAAIDEEPDGVYEVPEENSTVLVGIIGNDSNTAFLLKCSKVKKRVVKVGDMGVQVDQEGVILNKGENKGLIILDKLKEDLEKVNNLLDAIKQVASTPVNEPGNGAPSAFQAALNGAIASLQLPQYNEIENDKVKH